MDKRSKIALYSIGAVILLMMIAEVTKPKALNWRDSYSSLDKIPLGCYILFNELKSISSNEILVSTESAYEHIKKVSDSSKTSLLLINNYINIDEEESKALIEYVEKGNTVFISSNYFSGVLADTLNVSVSRDYDDFFKKSSLNKFTSPSLKENKKIFKDVIENNYISSIDTLQTVALGTISNEDNSVTNINFVKVPFGNNDGNFYIHTNPFAFTNYHMLDDETNYAAAVLSYLPKHQIIWDNYYKSGRKIITSPLRFILTNPALKWAFYLSLISLFLFVLFRGKRTQRIIPVIEPLKNSTVEFTQTIGDLYYQHGDFSNIIDKKILYFLEYIRTTYYLNTNTFDEQFINKLAIKSTNTIQDTKAIIDYIIFLKSKSNHTQNELIALNKKIEKFTKNSI